VAAALAVGLAVGSATADPGDPVAEMRQMHGEMHASHGGMGMGGHMVDMADMVEMHPQMSARLSDENRALHDQMHEACRLANERTNS
jgi:hypothetical protein